MRSPQEFVSEYGDRTGARLASIYRLSLAWYVFGITVLASLGIEPIYQHVTPFYAQYFPASSFATPNILPLFVAVLAYGIVHRVLGIRLLRPIRLGFAICGVLGIAFLTAVSDVTYRGMDLSGFWTGFKWHLPALCVVIIFSVIIVLFFRRIRWWDVELSNKAAWRAVFGLIVFAFVSSGSIAMIREGTDGIAAAYSRTGYEYIDDIGKGLTLSGFLRDYNELHPMLSMHAKVHPPGPVVMLWVMSKILLSRDPLVLSIGTMAVGSMTLLPLFAWVRDMLNQRVALTCCAFFALAPSIVLFTATSADIMFLPLVVLTLLCFWRAIHRGSITYACGAGVLYAFMSLTSFSLLSLGAFFAWVGLWRMQDLAFRGNVIKTAVLMLAAFLAAHGAVYGLTGFNIITCFELSHAQFQEDQSQLDITSPRYGPWAFKLLNPLCWIYFVGIPATVLWCWRMIKLEHVSRPLFIVFALTLLVLAPLYLARGEGERSAMYIFPFIIVPAAHLLDELGQRAQSFRPMAATFLFLVFQTWLTETLLYTYW